MFRAITVIFLIAALAAQTFNKAVIVFDYYSNAAAFAKNCENKARPAMHCRGKCQMMKKLQQQEKKEQENPEKKGQNKNEVVSAASYFAGMKNRPAILQNSMLPLLVAAQAVDRASDIFHPPA